MSKSITFLKKSFWEGMKVVMQPRLRATVRWFPGATRRCGSSPRGSSGASTRARSRTCGCCGCVGSRHQNHPLGGPLPEVGRVVERGHLQARAESGGRAVRRRPARLRVEVRRAQAQRGADRRVRRVRGPRPIKDQSAKGTKLKSSRLRLKAEEHRGAPSGWHQQKHQHQETTPQASITASYSSKRRPKGPNARTEFYRATDNSDRRG